MRENLTRDFFRLFDSMYDIAAFTVTLVTAIAVVLLTLRRPADTLRQVEKTDVSQSVYTEELASTKVSNKPSARAASKKGLSDKEFKELFLKSDKSLRDIAKATGYKSNSSVYRRAKRLGLSIKDRQTA